jgi:hypothetical protein
VRRRIAWLKIFRDNNPAFTFQTANLIRDQVYEGGKPAPISWRGIPAEGRPLVRRQLLAFQWVSRLTDDTRLQEALLTRGYDSPRRSSTCQSPIHAR